MGRILYNNNEISKCIEDLYREYNLFCQYYEIEDSDYIGNYELFLSCGHVEWNVDNQEFESIKENQLYTFFRRLKTEDYRAILLNDKEVMIYGDKYTDYFYDNLISKLDNFTIEISCDCIRIIHNNGVTDELKGYEEMSCFEIFTRQFLLKEGSEDLQIVIKDNLWQDDFNEEQFHDLEYCYNKCKDIKFVEFVEENKEMNGNAIMVYYKDNTKEIWQPL